MSIFADRLRKNCLGQQGEITKCYFGVGSVPRNQSEVRALSPLKNLMKSPILPVSLPSEIRAEIVKLATKKNVSVSEYIRCAVIEKLSLETGKKYDGLQWGGVRSNAGRKPSKPAVRTHRDSVMSESAKIPTRKVKSAV